MPVAAFVYACRVEEGHFWFCLGSSQTVFSSVSVFCDRTGRLLLSNIFVQEPSLVEPLDIFNTTKSEGSQQ